MVKKILFILLLVLGFLIKNEHLALAASPIPKFSSEEMYQTIDGKNCGFFTGCAVAGQDVKAKISGIKYNNGTPVKDGTYVVLKLKGKGCIDIPAGSIEVKNGSVSTSFTGSLIMTDCTYSLNVLVPKSKDAAGNTIEANEYDSPFSQPTQASCAADECSEDLATLNSSLYELCAQIKTDTPQYSACMSCFLGQGIWTAIGCIPSNPQKIIQTIITIGLALGGGIVLIMILAGSFMLSVSQGDPNKTKEAKEMITSAIIGLLFVIFSVTILQFIGVSILHIPGFGE